MKALVTFMARSPLLWRFWLTIGTPFWLIGLALDVLLSCLDNIRRMWGWEWRDAIKNGLHAYTEAHRKAVLKSGPPIPGGVLWRKPS